MIYEDIKNFSGQFAYEPVIQDQSALGDFNKFIVVGMGGSALAAGFLKIWKPALNITIHRNYGLPDISEEDLKESLIILNSYSGNTEEVIDAYHEAGRKKLSRAVVSTGGELLSLARNAGLPFIQMPDAKIQPRLAIGFNFMALLKLIGDEKSLSEATGLSQSLNLAQYEEEGKGLAKKLIGFVPVVYASSENESLAYAWKVVFNETGKIPAFWNVLPELNHNEMTGFSAGGGPASGGDVSEIKQLAKNLYFLIFEDDEDDSRITKRAQTLKKLYRERDLNVQALRLGGKSRLEKLFASYIFANQTAYYLALHYSVDPEAVPMVEEFKKLIK